MRPLETLPTIRQYPGSRTPLQITNLSQQHHVQVDMTQHYHLKPRDFLLYRQAGYQLTYTTKAGLWRRNKTAEPIQAFTLDLKFEPRYRDPITKNLLPAAGSNAWGKLQTELALARCHLDSQQGLKLVYDSTLIDVVKPLEAITNRGIYTEDGHTLTPYEPIPLTTPIPSSRRELTLPFYPGTTTNMINLTLGVEIFLPQIADVDAFVYDHIQRGDLNETELRSCAFTAYFALSEGPLNPILMPQYA